jgi:hypothetical protein
LQKTPSKIKFEGVFLIFDPKMPSKVKNEDSLYPTNLDIVESTETWAFIVISRTGQGDEKVSSNIQLLLKNV